MNNIMWLWLMVLNIRKLHSCIVIQLPCRTTLKRNFIFGVSSTPLQVVRSKVSNSIAGCKVEGQHPSTSTKVM